MASTRRLYIVCLRWSLPAFVLCEDRFLSDPKTRWPDSLLLLQKPPPPDCLPDTLVPLFNLLPVSSLLPPFLVQFESRFTASPRFLGEFQRSPSVSLVLSSCPYSSSFWSGLLFLGKSHLGTCATLGLT